MKFYDCTGAPSPRRVCIFIAEKGIKLDTIQVDLMGGENLKPEYLAINPRGLVPSLILDDGTCLDESFSICRYLEELYPSEPCLMGHDARSRALIDSRTRAIETDGFIPGAEVFRNSNPAFASRGTPGESGVPAIQALAERGAIGIQRFYERLEAMLKESEFIAGNQFSFADITGLCVVDFFGWVKMEIPDSHERTKRWYGAVSSRPSVRA